MSTDKQYKKFKKLDEEWRNAALGMEVEDINKLIRDCAVNIVELALAKGLDEDLARLREELATAEKQYKDGAKINNLRIEFLVEVLRGRGIEIAGFSKKEVLAKAREEVSKSEETPKAELPKKTKPIQTPEVGAKVMLKNGGPVMEVTEITAGGKRVTCVWDGMNPEEDDGDFAVSMLVAVT